MHNFAAFSLVTAWRVRGILRRGAGADFCMQLCTFALCRQVQHSLHYLPPHFKFMVAGRVSVFLSALHAPASDSLLPDVALSRTINVVGFRRSLFFRTRH